MTDELKPCPFCGGNVISHGGDDKWVGAWCEDCAAMGPNHYGRYEWNTRTSADAQAALERVKRETRNEALKDAADRISAAKEGGTGADMIVRDWAIDAIFALMEDTDDER